MSTTSDAMRLQKLREKIAQGQRFKEQSIDQKIQMIKSLRNLAIILGKFGFNRFVTDHDERWRQTKQQMPFPKGRPPWPTGKSYGMGLKEAKDTVEHYLDRKATAAAT